ncbi:succinyl-CoA synthetase-like protein [Xylariomycetidae sp. FL2044]|nr:succinyl-CoA synthetase-like protein [Xylariomycetidae sp. FL2044]
MTRSSAYGPKSLPIDQTRMPPRFWRTMIGQRMLPRSNTTTAATNARSRLFGSTNTVRNYHSTLGNLKIGRHTRVIFQGFTGRQATANAQESIAWGTNIVGGVTPGREGEHLGLPVLPTVRKAMEVLQPDATGIYVAAHQAPGAIEEAIEAEVPLIVAVAEHIPLHDMIRIHSVLKTQSKSRLVGANSPGIISSTGKCRIGFQPLPCFEPGTVGIVARSGTLSYETAASTLRSGLGQSMCIGVGGDILPGTTLRDGLQILTEDDDTEAVALVGEIGGDAEIEAAEWIREYRIKTGRPKPIAALVGGINAVPDRIMGHAGAFTLPGEPSALEKVDALRAAGAAIVNHPSRFGPVLKSMLGGSATSGAGRIFSSSQRRGLHTMTRTRTRTGGRPSTTSAVSRERRISATRDDQRRGIYLTGTSASDLLRQHGLPVTVTVAETPDAGSGPQQRLLAITINWSTKSPCVVASPTGDPSQSKRFDFDYRTGVVDPGCIPAIASHLALPASSAPSLQRILTALTSLFMTKEAFLLSTSLVLLHTPQDSPQTGTGTEPETLTLASSPLRLGFDDAAFRSGGRHADIHTSSSSSPPRREAELEAERHGIVYIRLPGPRANIGTLVNGAGLAMNTMDALADAGGRAANFLDTGGKATSETVKRSFEVILRDERVKCIFVNIFGGLTLGDMIARGVVLAFRDLRVGVPVVVRIRGTREREGREIIARSGLRQLFAFDDFDEAAAKAIELAEGGCKEEE